MMQILTLSMTDGTERTIRLTLTQSLRFEADYRLYQADGSPTWGQYQNQSGDWKHVEFALVTRYRVQSVQPVQSAGWR